MKHLVINPALSFRNNMHRILLFYNHQAIHHLEGNARVHHHIHEARLSFKRIRSMLRLGRQGLGEQVFRDLNTRYRDLARSLSLARDLTAMTEALEPLIRTRRDPANRDLLLEIRKSWQVQRNKLMAGEHIDAAREQALSELHRLNREIEQAHLITKQHLAPDTGFEVYIRGMKKVFRRGKSLFADCKANPDDHNLHEWRKQVKYMWYHSVLLNPVWPGMMKAWAKEWQALSVVLGQHHDLVMVKNGLRAPGKWSGKKREIAAISRSIRRNKERLASQALKMGERLFGAGMIHPTKIN